jgi:hypothetical protein
LILVERCVDLGGIVDHIICFFFVFIINMKKNKGFLISNLCRLCYKGKIT